MNERKAMVRHNARTLAPVMTLEEQIAELQAMQREINGDAPQAVVVPADPATEAARKFSIEKAAALAGEDIMTQTFEVAGFEIAEAFALWLRKDLGTGGALISDNSPMPTGCCSHDFYYEVDETPEVFGNRMALSIIKLLKEI